MTEEKEIEVHEKVLDQQNQHGELTLIKFAIKEVKKRILKIKIEALPDGDNKD